MGKKMGKKLNLFDRIEIISCDSEIEFSCQSLILECHLCGTSKVVDLNFPDNAIVLCNGCQKILLNLSRKYRVLHVYKCEILLPCMVTLTRPVSVKSL